MTQIIQTCKKCGVAHVSRSGGQACAGHRRRDGLPCQNHPINGATVCKFHGGAAPHVRKKAAERYAEQKAMAVVRTLGLPMDVGPTEALLEEVRWTAGHVQWLRGKVDQLSDGHDAQTTTHPLVWGETKRVDKEATKHPGQDVTEEAGVSIWYQLYLKEREHLVQVCAAAIRAGVEERRVRLAEQQGDLIADVIQAILADLKLSPAQQEQVATVVPRHLVALAGGAA